MVIKAKIYKQSGDPPSMGILSWRPKREKISAPVVEPILDLVQEDIDHWQSEGLLEESREDAGLGRVIKINQPSKIPRRRHWGRVAAAAAGIAATLLTAAYTTVTAYAKEPKKAVERESPEAYQNSVKATFFKGLDKSNLVSKGVDKKDEHKLSPVFLDIMIGDDYDRCPSVGRLFENAEQVRREVLEGKLTPNEIKAKYTVDPKKIWLSVYDREGNALDGLRDPIEDKRVIKVPIDGAILAYGPFSTNNCLPLELRIKQNPGGLFEGTLQCGKEEFRPNHFIPSSDIRKAVKCGDLVGNDVGLAWVLPIPMQVEEGGKKKIKYENLVIGTVPVQFVDPSEVEELRMASRFREYVKNNPAPAVRGSGLPSLSTPAPQVPQGSSQEINRGIPKPLQEPCPSCLPKPVSQEYESSEVPQTSHPVSRKSPYDVSEDDSSPQGSHWSAAMGPAIVKGKAVFQPLSGIDPELTGWQWGIYADAAYASHKSMAEARLLYAQSNVEDRGLNLNAKYKLAEVDGFFATKLGPISIGARGALSSESFDDQSFAGFNRGTSTLEALLGIQMGDKFLLGALAGIGKVRDNTQEPPVPESNGIKTLGGMGHVDTGRFVLTGMYEKLFGSISGTDVDIKGSQLKIDGRFTVLQGNAWGLGVAGGFLDRNIDFNSANGLTTAAPYDSSRVYGDLVLTFR